MEHFDIKDRYDLLTHCYDRFDKPFFAGLCKRLAESANAGDALAASLFRDAGREMAAHLVAMADQISPQLASAAGGLPVVCIGSVWKSFALMKDGFVQEVKANAKGRVK
jgi:N-acetylglucosamine kinase